MFASFIEIVSHCGQPARFTQRRKRGDRTHRECGLGGRRTFQVVSFGSGPSSAISHLQLIAGIARFRFWRQRPSCCRHASSSMSPYRPVDRKRVSIQIIGPRTMRCSRGGPECPICRMSAEGTSDSGVKNNDAPRPTALLRERQRAVSEVIRPLLPLFAYPPRVLRLFEQTTRAGFCRLYR